MERMKGIEAVDITDTKSKSEEYIPNDMQHGV